MDPTRLLLEENEELERLLEAAHKRIAELEQERRATTASHALALADLLREKAGQV